MAPSGAETEKAAASGETLWLMAERAKCRDTQAAVVNVTKHTALNRSSKPPASSRTKLAHGMAASAVARIAEL